MRRVGSRNVFAIEYAFSPDPDDGKAALPEESHSWGCFAIWVNGLNLCQSSYNNETSDVVSWYLYPVISWFARNWQPLLYEEQPPAPTERSVARAMFFEYAKQAFGFMSEEDGTAWYNWGQRHALRSCSNGGIFPDVFMRAYGDCIEFSWGNAYIPGAPAGLFFTAPYGSEVVERSVVKGVLADFLIAATGDLLAKMPESHKLQDLDALLSKISEYDIHHYLPWMIPALRDNRADKENLLEKFGKFVDISTQDFIPAPVLMFGSLSPAIQERDVAVIADAIQQCREDHPLFSFIRRIPIPDKKQYESGYDLSLDFIEEFRERYNTEADLDCIVNVLGIAVVRDAFSDTSMRGIAMAGRDVAPTVFVNTAHPHNTRAHGERFTIAHEICHLLFDRQYGQEVGISSGPWAPVGVEKRANAFAAMLLMPPGAVEEKIRSVDDLARLATVRDIAEDLHVSATAFIEHLFNLGAIGILDRDRLRKENRDSQEATEMPDCVP